MMVLLMVFVRQLRRDAPLGSALPTFVTNSTNYNASVPLQAQTVFWNALSGEDTNEGWTGFALLIDDVERYVGAALNFSLASLQEGIPHFFRLAVRLLLLLGLFGSHRSWC